jgi:hypothetical protein
MQRGTKIGSRMAAAMLRFSIDSNDKSALTTYGPDPPIRTGMAFLAEETTRWVAMAPLTPHSPMAMPVPLPCCDCELVFPDEGEWKKAQ